MSKGISPDGIKEKILNRLLSGHSLTAMQSISWWKYTRLAARISELREAGYLIETEMVGKGKTRFARYKMKGAK